MLVPAGERLGGAHRKQVHRDPWPDFEAFDPKPWPETQRRAAALQWAGLARNEHGSVQQFAQLTQVLSSACVALLSNSSICIINLHPARGAGDFGGWLRCFGVTLNKNGKRHRWRLFP